MSRRGHLLLLAVATAACLITPLLIVTGVHGPARVAATLALFSLAPGAAILGGRRRGTVELGVVLATSLACCVLVAEVMVAAGVWAPEQGACIVALFSLPGVATRLYRMSKREPPALSDP